MFTFVTTFAPKYDVATSTNSDARSTYVCNFLLLVYFNTHSFDFFIFHFTPFTVCYFNGFKTAFHKI